MIHLAFTSSENGKLIGFITDKKSGRPIDGAQVIVEGENRGSISDSKGFFQIKLPTGYYLIKVKMMGYAVSEQNLFIQTNTTHKMDFSLEPTVLEIATIEVLADKFKHSDKISIYDIKPRDLNTIPAVLEPDILRAMQTLPGVTFSNDYSSQFYVRGGHYDQTLILLDDVPVYNPNHIGGFFGVFNPNAVSDATLEAGGYTAEDDGYLSAILRVSTHDGNKTEHNLLSTTTLSSSNIALNGPLWKGRYSFAIRRTFLDFIAKMDHAEMPYYFYDVHGKYTINLNRLHKLVISTFYSHDVLSDLDEEEMNIDNSIPPQWGNLLFNSQLRSVINSITLHTMHLFYSSSYMDVRSAHNLVHNKLHDITFKDNFQIHLQNHNLNIGFEIKKMLFAYDWNIQKSDFYSIVAPPQDVFMDYAPEIYTFDKTCYQLGFYFQDDIKISNLLSINTGLRVNYFSSGHIKNIVPRLNIKYQLTSDLKIKAAYGKYHQFLYTLRERVSESIYSPFITYFPVQPGKHIEPAESQHFILGVDINKFLGCLDMSCEGYYKRNKNLLSTIVENPGYQMEDGVSTGIDLLLKKDRGRMGGWLSYSFGISLKDNDNATYYTQYDRRHILKILNYLNLTKKWKINFFWTYADGTPYSPVVGAFLGGDDYRVQFAEPYFKINLPFDPYEGREIRAYKNSHRYPDYHRLDISMTLEFNWKNYSIIPFVQVVNVYNQNNPYLYNQEYLFGAVSTEECRGIPVIPMIGIHISR